MWPEVSIFDKINFYENLSSLSDLTIFQKREFSFNNDVAFFLRCASNCSIIISYLLLSLKSLWILYLLSKLRINLLWHIIVNRRVDTSILLPQSTGWLSVNGRSPYPLVVRLDSRSTTPPHFFPVFGLMPKGGKHWRS